MNVTTHKSNHTHTTTVVKQYGILIPYHNGNVSFSMSLCFFNFLTSNPGTFHHSLLPTHFQLTTHYSLHQEFFGKVVRVDLQEMGNNLTCQASYRMDSFDANGNIVTTGTPGLNVSDACVYVIDLGTKHPQAKGFRRGFVNYPYGYLSAGHYSVVARLNLEDFSLETTRLVDLSELDRTYGGYAGGFADGTWACFK